MNETEKRQSDADRLETYANAEVLARECEHYGLPVPPPDLPGATELGGYLRILLRHIFNNRDATYGAMRLNVELLEQRLEQRLDDRGTPPPRVFDQDAPNFVAVAPAHLTPDVGPFDSEDAVYAFCEEQTRQGDHYRPASGGKLLPWPREAS